MHTNIQKLQNEEVVYRDHTIRLIYRPPTNDWQYVVEHTVTLTLTGVAPRYDSALRRAKQDVNIVVDGPKP